MVNINAMLKAGGPVHAAIFKSKILFLSQKSNKNLRRRKEKVSDNTKSHFIKK